jgi:hypothetical protein
LLAFLRRLLRACGLGAIASAATASAATSPRLALARWLRRTLLLLLLPLLAALGVRLLPALRARAFSFVGTAIALAGPRTLALAALFATLFRHAGALFPLAHFLLHEASLLRVGARAHLIESAVRAALPTFRISLLAV